MNRRPRTFALGYLGPPMLGLPGDALLVLTGFDEDFESLEQDQQYTEQACPCCVDQSEQRECEREMSKYEAELHAEREAHYREWAGHSEVWRHLPCDSCPSWAPEDEDWKQAFPDLDWG